MNERGDVDFFWLAFALIAVAVIVMSHMDDWHDPKVSIVKDGEKVPCVKVEHDTWECR